MWDTQQKSVAGEGGEGEEHASRNGGRQKRCKQNSKLNCKDSIRS